MASPTDDRSIIPISHMPQQVHVWTADDDWTGVVDRKERRRLQNRQNQRKWRERKKLLKRSQSPTSSASNASSLENEKEITCARAPPNALEYRITLERAARESYMRGAPNPEHLIGLTKLNVHRAIGENIRIIGMDNDWMKCDDTLSIFNLKYPHSLAPNFENIPVALRPTDIQKSMPHHPWLDFFPFPGMRDCLITAAHLFDDEELCHDLMAFWDTRNTNATLIVWGESWDPRNWEVTEEFAAKWGWLLRGSPELLVSTNYWRRRRGEKPVAWKKILTS
ncbi:hypothetical protein BJY04DRAFT_155852 [Aspergillus karnatakaensis]|uniref:bZIP transcription factor n=1 Tax=Aspergillus karnatakaensis TaxID=1810916 RepID=UPI003CCDF6A4